MSPSTASIRSARKSPSGVSMKRGHGASEGTERISPSALFTQDVRPSMPRTMVRPSLNVSSSRTCVSSRTSSVPVARGAVASDSPGRAGNTRVSAKRRSPGRDSATCAARRSESAEAGCGEKTSVAPTTMAIDAAAATGVRQSHARVRRRAATDSARRLRTERSTSMSTRSGVSKRCTCIMAPIQRSLAVSSWSWRSSVMRLLRWRRRRRRPAFVPCTPRSSRGRAAISSSLPRCWRPLPWRWSPRARRVGSTCG